MSSITIPELYCPFTSKLHPQVELAQKHTIEWAMSFQLLKDVVSFKRFKQLKSAYLVGRTFADTDLERLCLAADWTSWLYLFDDQCDNNEIGKKPEELKKVIDEFVTILYEDKEVTLENGIPLAAALSDLWERLKEKAPKGWKERYRKGVKEYLEAMYWEAKNRAYGVRPSISEYMHMRAASGAAHTVLDLTEITQQLTLSNEVLENPIFRRLYDIANVTANWANDVISFEKEQSFGDVHNLVILFQHEKKLSLQEAISESVKVHDNDIAEFIRLEKELPSFGEEMDQQVKIYLQTLKSWMRGHINWIINDTRRFEEKQGDQLMD